MVTIRHHVIPVACMFNLAGCATIVGDKTQLIDVSSTPSQAKVKISDEASVTVFEGQTPTNVTLQKGGGYFHGKDYKVEVTKEGHQPQVVDLKTYANGWYVVGNILFGGLIGWLIVDPATGAMWNIDPEGVNVTLSQSAPGTQ